jgi:hypothetical protein
MEIANERGRSTSTNGWKRRRIIMVSSNGVAGLLGARACIVRMYSLA